MTGKVKFDSADKSDTVSFAKNAVSKELGENRAGAGAPSFFALAPFTSKLKTDTIHANRKFAKGVEMNIANEMVRLFSPSAGKIHVAGEYVAMPIHRGVESSRGHASAAARLHVAGSTGVKSFRLVDENELKMRKERALAYDFAAIS